MRARGRSRGARRRPQGWQRRGELEQNKCLAVIMTVSPPSVQLSFKPIVPWFLQRRVMGKPDCGLWGCINI
jgi:hypothetical protein